VFSFRLGLGDFELVKLAKEVDLALVKLGLVEPGGLEEERVPMEAELEREMRDLEDRLNFFSGVVVECLRRSVPRSWWDKFRLGFLSWSVVLISSRLSWRFFSSLSSMLCFVSGEFVVFSVVLTFSPLVKDPEIDRKDLFIALHK